MKKYRYSSLNVISAIVLCVFLLFPGMNPNLAGQPDGSGSDGISYSMALPTIIAAPASGTGPTIATLNGFVNANNESSTVLFEYSTDGNFADEETPPPMTIAATPSPVTGAGITAVSANITGLTSGTVYFFRTVATNASGTAYGNILQFITDPPASVTTGIASPVTTTTATLNGIVNANSNSTTVTFEYGTTVSYGATVTADQSPVTGTSDTAVSKAITGLSPNTTYHFRVVGDNANGTGNGENMTFFTSAQTAPTVTTGDTTYSTAVGTATLHGTVNANNADATVTFEYGTTTAYGNTVTADQSPVLGSTDTAVSKLITGLLSDTTYHYRVVATNSIGTTNGADMTFYNTTAPYAKTEDASSISQTTATLNGTVNPKTVEFGPPTTVTFEYGLTASYGTTVTANESPFDGPFNHGVSFNLAGLTPNTTYHYRVIADNVNGTGTGADMTFTTSSLPIVTTDTAAPVSTTSATLNGIVNANGDSTTVTFEYGLTTSYGTTVTADQSPASGTSDIAVSKGITGLTNGTTYHYRVVGTNSSGTTNGADMTFTTGITPPFVSTDAATAISTTSAIMNGTVNANGFSTAVNFEWGFTTSYGLTNPAIPNVVTGSSSTPVAFSPTTLLPNTTYHYRVAATSAGGTIYGADMSFTTNSAPAATTNPATSVTTTMATLNGTVNTNNQSSTVTFEYGTTTAYGTTVTADQSPVTGTADTAVSKAITGLTPGMTYHYRVVGTNASGTAYGADMTFFTSAPAAPSATTTTATSVTSNGATLNGTVNANNTGTTITFEYGTTVAYGTTVTADQSPLNGSGSTAVSKAITGLSNNTTYHYRVVATNANGTTNGADMTFTTNALTPSAITGTATNVLYTGATINGTVNGNIAGAIVTFEYGLTVGYGSSVSATPSSVPGDSTDYAVTSNLASLSPGTTYHYRVVADNIFVSPVNGADMTFTTPIGPDAVTNAATSIGANSATLNGTVNAQNASTTVTFEYGLTTSYGQTVTADQSPVTGNTNTTVTNTPVSLVPNTLYHYRVVVQNVNGVNIGSDMTFTTGAVVPTVTTDAASGLGATGATLNGTVNANNDSTTVTFEYGTTTAYGTTVTADQSPVTGSSNTTVSKGITGLTTNTTYHYRVKGQNGAGTTNGADMTFTTGTNTPTAATDAASGIGTTGATLNGTVNANGASTTITFEYGTSTAYGKSLTADQSPVTGTSDTAATVSISGLIATTTYHYRVVGQNAFGTTYGTDLTFVTAGNAPSATTNAATSVGSTTTILNGTVNANNDSTTVTFQYGTTTAYGKTVTANPSPVTGGSDTAVKKVLSGLTPGTTYHYRVVGQNAFGTAYGIDGTFTTSTETPANTVTITNPTDGEHVSGTVSIEATVTTNTRTGDSAQAVSRVEFYIDDIIIGTDTSEPYQTDWDTTAESDGSHTIKAVAYSSGDQTSQDEITVTVLNNGEVELWLNRTQMNFGAVPNGSGSSDSFFDITYNQTLLINHNGGSTLSWSISDDAAWLSSSPASGTGLGVVSVGVDPSGLSAGTYTAVLTVESDSGSSNSATVDVTLVVYNAGAVTGPLGTFSTPVDGSTVMSSIPVTGWVLDDIATSSVRIFRNSVSGDSASGSSGMVYIGDADFVDSARPDVEALYPGYPLNYQAGWGYMLLTNGLPGDGTYTLYAIATDVEGNAVTLGSKTITVDNASAVKPFGTIDTPDQGGEAWGSSFVNFGWALTPQPNTIPIDGSTIKVWIDGVSLPGNPVYNLYREDIAGMFPGYNNTDGAVGYMTIDTTQYLNGIHSISWSVQDDAGNSDGIGSRYFSILNTGGSLKTGTASGFSSIQHIAGHEAVENTEPVIVRKGFGTGRIARELTFNETGTAILVIKELEPVQIQPAAAISGARGYLVIDGRLAPLPVGTTFDERSGTFSWLPGPGFFGTYRFTFIYKTYNGQFQKKSVNIRVEPKFTMNNRQDLEAQRTYSNKTN